MPNYDAIDSELDAALGNHDYSEGNLASLAKKASAYYNVPGLTPGMLLGILKQESGFNPGVIGTSGEKGAGQFMPGTASSKDKTGKVYWNGSHDPAVMLDGVARLMRDNYIDSNGDMTKALRMYNGGSKPGDATIPYAENVKALATGFDKKWAEKPGDAAPARVAKPENIDAELDKVLGPTEAPVSPPKQAQTQGELPTQTQTEPNAPDFGFDFKKPVVGWNALDAGLNAGTMGAYEKLKLIAATHPQEMYAASMEGAPMMPSQIDYMQSLQGVPASNAAETMQASKSQYETEHPYANAAARIAGVAPWVMAGTGLLQSGIRALPGLVGADATSGLSIGANNVARLIGGSAPEANFGNFVPKAIGAGVGGAVGGGLNYAAEAPTNPNASWGGLGDAMLYGGVGGAALGRFGSWVSPQIGTVAGKVAQKLEQTTGIKLPIGVWSAEKGLPQASGTDIANVTNGVNKAVGIPSPVVTQEAFDQAKATVGAKLGAARAAAAPDLSLTSNSQFWDGLQNIRNAIIGGNPAEPLDTKALRYFDNIHDFLVKDQINQLSNMRMGPNGLKIQMSPEALGLITQHGGKLDEMRAALPNSHYADRIENELNTAMERTGNPSAVQNYRDANKQYWALKQLEPHVPDAISNNGKWAPARLASAFSDARSSEFQALRDAANYLPPNLDKNGIPINTGGTSDNKSGVAALLAGGKNFLTNNMFNAVGTGAAIWNHPNLAVGLGTLSAGGAALRVAGKHATELPVFGPALRDALIAGAARGDSNSNLITQLLNSANSGLVNHATAGLSGAQK